MIGMALDAGIGIFGMDTLLLFDSFSKLVMTVETFTIRDPASKGMTLGTILDPLVLGVWRREFPRAY